MISELLPSSLLVRIGNSLPHCQDCVKHQDSLSGPLAQVSMNRRRHLELNVGIVVKSFIDVLQTWRAFNVLGDREAKAHSFAILDVGVLSDNHDLQISEGHVFEGVENQILRWEDSLRLVLALDELVGLSEGLPLQVIVKWPLPAS